MKDFDETSSHSGDDRSPLRIVSKQGQNINRVQFDRANDRQNGTPFGNLTERAHQILRGGMRWLSALQHKLDRLTLGLYSRSPRFTLGTIVICGIIMFSVLRKNVASAENTATFASSNGKSKEKTRTEGNTDKNKQKRNNTSPASINQNVSFDLAPASVADLKEPDVKSYIERYSKTAVSEMDAYGIPASISMAQAIIESRSGTSVLAVRNNNHFGIKCFSKSCPPGHCNNFTDDHHKDFFVKYAGTWESWRAHSQFLMKHSYKKLLRSGKNYKAWARGLRELGYATDATYDKKLIGIIERYELYKLDDL